MSNIEISDDVFLLTNSKYRYVITYENVQLYEVVNRDAKLTKISKSFVFNERKESHFSKNLVINVDRIACFVAIRRRMKIEIDSAERQQSIFAFMKAEIDSIVRQRSIFVFTFHDAISFFLLEESKKLRKRTSKTKKFDEMINVKRTRKTYDENVNEIQTRQHENNSADRHDQNNLSDFDKNILIERDMKSKFKNIDKLFDEIKFKTIYEKQNHESFNKSFSSFKTLLSQTRFESNFKKKMYVFMKSTIEFLI